jgi:hypothetical protein
VPIVTVILFMYRFRDVFTGIISDQRVSLATGLFLSAETGLCFRSEVRARVLNRLSRLYYEH